MNISYKQTLHLLEVTKDLGLLLHLLFQPPLSNPSRARGSVERWSFMTIFVLLLQTATCARIRETVLQGSTSDGQGLRRDQEIKFKYSLGYFSSIPSEASGVYM